ncbi:MAG: hypothetical protein ACRCXM_12810 [Beijerinckiaceae bacterium]
MIRRFAAAVVMAAGMMAGAPQAQATFSAPAAAMRDGAPALTETAGWRGHRGLHRGHGRSVRFHKPWRPVYRPAYYRPGFHRPRFYRPWRPAYVAPVYYGPRTVCRIRHRQVWTGWGTVWRPVRVCWRRW